MIDGESNHSVATPLHRTVAWRQVNKSSPLGIYLIALTPSQVGLWTFNFKMQKDSIESVLCQLSYVTDAEQDQCHE